MKTFKSAMLVFFAMISINTFAQEKTDSIKVYGNCGMCQNRIEKAAKLAGVTNASWDSETQILLVKYDAAKTNIEAIQKKVASVGHDTEKFTAPDEVYNKLHGCCKYERKKVEAKQ